MDSWPSKDPEDVLDYEFDWTLRLETGETISASTFTVVTGTVVKGTTAIDGAITRVWLSGGTLGERCEITNHITTSQARQWDRTAALRIRRH